MKTQFSVSAAICFSKHLVYLFNFKNKREADRHAEVHAQERSDLLNCTSGVSVMASLKCLPIFHICSLCLLIPYLIIRRSFGAYIQQRGGTWAWHTNPHRPSPWSAPRSYGCHDKWGRLGLRYSEVGKSLQSQVGRFWVMLDCSNHR